VGKGVRVGHIDLSEAIKREQSSRTDFENMFSASSSNKSTAPPEGQGRFFSLAFPVFSISRNEDRSASSALPLLGLSSSRKVNSLNELEIPLASTYGADTVEAMVRFYDYCRDERTHVRCTEKFARNLLGATVDERVVGPGEPAAKFKIRLQLITRAYLTSSIVHKQVFGGSAAIEAKAGPSSQSGQADTNSTLVHHQGGDSSDLSFDEKFERPLVFGFRSAVFVPLPD
jgi:hypothetical protein